MAHWRSILVAIALPLAWIVDGFALGGGPTSMPTSDEFKARTDNPSVSLDVPGFGQFAQIAISTHSWEGDSQGVSLKADGSWAAWSQGHSGVFPSKPPLARTLPPEAIHRTVQIIRDLKVPLTPHVDQARPPSKSMTEERLLTTTQGVLDVGSAPQLDSFLHSLRFYVEGKGILQSVETTVSPAPAEKRGLSLDGSGTLRVTQPGRSLPVRTWRVGEEQLDQVVGALPRESWASPGGAAKVRLLTDRGEFTAAAEGSAVAALLRDLYLRETGLDISPKERFEEIRMRVGGDQYVNNVGYFINLNARGELLAGVNGQQQSPIEVPGQRRTLTVPPSEVYELVQLLARKPIWTKKREGNQPGTKLPNGLFKVTEVIVNHAQFKFLPDQGGDIEKRLVDLYKKHEALSK